MKKAVIGIVDSDAQADKAVSELQRVAGIPSRDISVVLPDRRAAQGFADEHHTKAPEGAVLGSSAGGVLGGALGLLAGIGTLAIPGIGPLIAAGPLLATLSGVAAGAAVGGISGALVGLGIPESEARGYEGRLRAGSVLVAVHTESLSEQRAAREVLDRVGAHDIDVRSEATIPSDSRPLR
jgi:hypothetical protein